MSSFVLCEIDLTRSTSEHEAVGVGTSANSNHFARVWEVSAVQNPEPEQWMLVGSVTI